MKNQSRVTREDKAMPPDVAYGAGLQEPGDLIRVHRLS